VNGIPISEAAKRLGMTVEATRMRVRRGSIPAHKGEDGRWYVDIDDVQGDVLGADLNMGEPVQGDVQPPVSDAMIQAMIVMRQQMDTLTKQLEVKDAQLAEAAIERSELRRLLGNSQMMLTAGRSDASGEAQGAVDEESTIRPAQTPQRGTQRPQRASWRWPWQRRD